ncbi:hypothetical protein Btru_016962 [Bulinus truncatus]|nr:hypothetical protein Btru_016962 [Bulinus truncatus]
MPCHLYFKLQHLNVGTATGPKKIPEKIPRSLSKLGRRQPRALRLELLFMPIGSIRSLHQSKTERFILQSFTADRVLQFNYQDGSTEGQLVYSVVPIDHSQPVSEWTLGPATRRIIYWSNSVRWSYSWSLGCPRCPFGYQGFVCDERKALKTIPELPSIIWTCLVSFIVTGCLSFTLLTLVVVIVCLCCRHRKSARRTSLEQFRDGQTSNPYSVSSFISQSSVKQQKFKKYDIETRSPRNGQVLKLHKKKAHMKEERGDDGLLEEICVGMVRQVNKEQ